MGDGLGGMGRSGRLWGCFVVSVRVVVVVTRRNRRVVLCVYVFVCV